MCADLLGSDRIMSAFSHARAVRALERIREYAEAIAAGEASTLSGAASIRTASDEALSILREEP